MESRNKYIIPLRDMRADSMRYEFELNDEFFEMVDGPEIRRGNLKAEIEVRRVAESYTLDFIIGGYVILSCDRCLDDMEQDIDTEGHLKVKFGEEFNEVDDTLVIVPESEGNIDVAWYLYEFAALDIPMRHVHPEGQCNQEMSERLAKVLATTVDEAESDTEDEDNDKPTDPRWDALKNLKFDEN